MKCKSCDEEIDRSNRCTNGRCLPCHRLDCGPGGATEPGHGFKKDVQRRAGDELPESDFYGE